MDHLAPLFEDAADERHGELWRIRRPGQVGRPGVQVWNALKQARQADAATAPDWRLLGTIGHGLKLLRNRCDYDDNMPNLAARLPRALFLALFAIDTLLPRLRTRRPSPRTPVVARQRMTRNDGVAPLSASATLSRVRRT